MKRKTLKLLLSLTLVLCVALALPGLSAGADYVNSFEAGTDIGSIQVFSSNLVIKSYEKYAGSLPAGLSLSWATNCALPPGSTVSPVGCFVMWGGSPVTGASVGVVPPVMERLIIKE